MRQKKKQVRQSRRSLLHLEMLESRRVLAAIFPAYVNGAFTLGDANSPDGAPYGLSNTFDLESNPTATKTIYLDFDGHHSVNNSWGHNIMFPAYNTSGSSNSFSNGERIEIQKHFQNIAEDFLPFDVNVTTSDPGLDALTKSGGGDQTWGVRDLHTQATGGFGNGIGGVAFLDSFDDPIDNPVFSFNKGINNGAMTGSHEVGHSLGLFHDGLNGQTYHPGTGSGETGWGPIMGAPFGKNLTQWSNGDYSGSTTTQIDLAVITRSANGFTFRADQYGNNTTSAHELTPTNGTDIFEWGIIERRNDLDFFEFTTGAGNVSFDIQPFGENPNLDIEAKLYDSQGTEIATSNGLNVVDASFNENLAAGTYFISIDGTGRDGRYSDYGSLGFYSIDATIVEPTGGVDPIDITPLNGGVGVEDNATGPGHLMYTEESVLTRFGDLDPNNADHLVAVRNFGGQWQYNNNSVWQNFTPVASDVLLASVDFSADTVTSLEGTSGTNNGITSGYASGDLVYIADQWNGSPNNGEFDVAGTAFTPNDPGDPGTTVFVAPLNGGVGVEDNATGPGHLMYTEESVLTRFGDLDPNNADHLVAVRNFGGQWQYNNNSVWQNFTPVASDVLLASVDFSADTVTSLEGTSGTNNGITSGYASGDLVYIADQWNGSFNNGEFDVTGTAFTPNDPGDPGTTVFVAPLNGGVGVEDNATGPGHLMYTEESVLTRFGDLDPNNADHLVAVRNFGGQWQYNNNSVWQNFTPVASDVLLASVDFSADTVTSLEGTSGTVNGIASGYANGDLVYIADQWNGSFNNGEFGVTGTFFNENAAVFAPPTSVVNTVAPPAVVGDGGGGEAESGHEFDVYPWAPNPDTIASDEVVSNDVALERAYRSIEAQIRDNVRGRRDDTVTNSIDAVFSSFGRFDS